MDDYQTYKMNVCKNIKKFRLERKMTQEDVAGLEIALKTYQNIESGRYAPNLESMYKIAKTLGVHPSELIKVSLNTKYKKKSQAD